MNELNKTNEEIEVLELVIKKRREESSSYDEKVISIQLCIDNRSIVIGDIEFHKIQFFDEFIKYFIFRKKLK